MVGSPAIELLGRQTLYGLPFDALCVRSGHLATLNGSAAIVLVSQPTSLATIRCCYFDRYSDFYFFQAAFILGLLFWAGIVQQQHILGLPCTVSFSLYDQEDAYRAHNAYLDFRPLYSSDGTAFASLTTCYLVETLLPERISFRDSERLPKKL